MLNRWIWGIVGGVVLGLISVGRATPIGAPPGASGCRQVVRAECAGAQITVHRDDGAYCIRGIFANEYVGNATLRYELVVQRGGLAGTARTVQSGRFQTTYNRRDTLSTVRINVQPGDTVDLHLNIWRSGRLIDEAQRQLDL